MAHYSRKEKLQRGLKSYRNSVDMNIMQCPRCRSDYLLIRQRTGFERVLIFLTGLREYRCRDCDQKFRMPDLRLELSRIHKPAAAVARARQKPLARIPSRAA
ncbi:MAG: hypothetical protein EBY17_17375 [Acidobacteriia bacterium]|nr:hypothetical protein [Terriglobia bacterium]